MFSEAGLKQKLISLSLCLLFLPYLLSAVVVGPQGTSWNNGQYNQFQKGDTISSTQVNQNFDQLFTQVNKQATARVLSEYLSTSQTIPTNINVTVLFDTNYNSQGNTGLSYSGGTFTNISGQTQVVAVTYSICYIVSSNSSLGSRSTWVSYNSGTTLFAESNVQADNDNTTLAATAIIILNNNDTFAVQTWQNSLFTMYLGAGNQLSGTYIQIAVL